MPQGKTILYWAEKGGIGKTSISCISAYELSREGDKDFNHWNGYKTLLIDYDPQCNATQMMSYTYGTEFNPLVPFYNGLMKRDLSDSVVSINNNLDMIPADSALQDFPTKVANMNSESRYNILNESLEPLRNKYDYIIIDVPPTLNAIVQNAIHVHSIYISLILQSQRLAYNSMLQSISDLQDIANNTNADFNFMGIILYLYNNASVDRTIERESNEKFGEAMFHNRIEYQERVKGFSSNGIEERKYWSALALNKYKKVIKELLSKIRDDDNEQ